MRASGGLTILELVIAVFILAVGILAAASMQTSGLRFSTSARVIQEVTNAVRAEVEMQRSSPQSTCWSDQPGGQSCTVTVTPCWIASGGGSLTCATTTPAGPVVADQITVTITRPPHAPLAVTTVVAR